MPEVPVADPFGNYDKTKSQERAPQSPLPRRQVRDSVFMPNLASLPSKTMLMMAAATMHDQGRLFEEPK